MTFAVIDIDKQQQLSLFGDFPSQHHVLLIPLLPHSHLEFLQFQIASSFHSLDS